jgi:hypothetical protein
MKKIIIYCLLCCDIVAALTSCVDYNDATTETTARIQLQMPADFINTANLSGHEIVMIQGEKRLSATTDAQGVAVFENLIPDVYDISCSWELTAEEYRQATGDNQVVSGCTVSGSLNAQLIKDEPTIRLSTQLSINRDIIISKIYYAGSKDDNNRSYDAGKYLELYNQSDKEVDVSGLYIGLVEAESTQAYTLDNLHEAFADSIVLLKQIFRIPADASHTVSPGATVLLANSAINHSSVDAQESDLSGADFEAKDFSSRPVQNNPATPALDLIYTMYPSISIMNLVQSGPCGVVIFRTNEDVATWPTTYPYGKTTGNQWKLLPKRHIIDGVEVLRNRTTGVEVGEKRLYNDIDAGYVYINAISGRSGEVIYRKTSKRSADGHLILSDTNNSSNDFQVSLTIKPREYDE